MLIVFNGCASFANLGNSARKDNGDPSQRYQVEMANMVGRPQIYEGQLEKNMTVQQALEKSGAIRRYRKMDVSIMRVVEETGQPLKLVVNYNGAKRLVSPEQDYALLPGDRVVVEPAVGLLDRLGGSK
jgi:protein involved in polysaccharide export with SLBB domain